MDEAARRSDHRRRISYSGIKFEGSPRAVFWSRYIEPFLEDIVGRAVDRVLQLCTEKGADKKDALMATEGLLVSLINQTYAHMADVDRRLRGGGFPKSVPMRDTKLERGLMIEFVEQRVRAEIAMLAPPLKLARWNQVYQDHPFVFWLVTTALFAALGIMAL